MMAITVAKLYNQLCLFSSVSSQQSLQHSIISAIESKHYAGIVDILNTSNQTRNTSNPFSLLSKFHQNHITKTIDEILQSFIPIRPRSRPKIAYSYLLSFTLQNPNPFPLSFAILQRTLRSGCVPVPQTHLLLSNVWLLQRKTSDQTIAGFLLQMKSIGYQPDNGICNYLISSLCKVDEYEEAVDILQNMSSAGCVPDLETFCSVIWLLCDLRKTKNLQELMKQMVVKFRLSPRKEMVVKVLKAFRGNKEVKKAVEMVSFFEKMDVQIGFESYEMVVEMCLESGLFVLAGKVVMRMTNRGFIPFIRVRQKVFEGLVSVGEVDFAYVINKKFTELNS